MAGKNSAGDCDADDFNDAAVHAAAKVVEALEVTERARAHLYSFHQLTGHVDLLLEDAVRELSDAGHGGLAHHITTHLLGRNVLPGRWSLRVVEDYDDYYACVKDVESLVVQRLTDGRRHAFEAAINERWRTCGHLAHTAAPPEAISESTKE